MSDRKESAIYAQNHLACRLRAATDDAALFATLEDGRHESYGDFFAAAERTAAALVAAGLVPGDRVAVQVEKSLAALHLYLGTVLAGGVFLPLNMAYTPAEIAYFLGDAEPKVFVCDPAKREALDEAANAAGVSTLLTLDRDGGGSLAELTVAQPDGFTAVARDADDLAAILYTSGTTGRSKGAMLTHENLASNALVLRDYWRFTAADVLIHALPIFHTHGLFVATNVTLMAGASLLFMTRFDADAIVAALPRASVLMGVPTYYVRLLEHPGLSRDAAKGMRLFVSGSAPLLSDTHRAWQDKTGHAILERYGLSETGMNSSNPYDGERRAGTVGFPLPGIEIKITDQESGDELGQDQVGAIEVRGPNVFKGYWRKPEKTAEELRADGFFVTGDLGVFDARGYLSIVGRSKDLIISGGYNVYPKEIETALDALDGVVESAAFGLPHPDFGEGVAAALVLQPGVELGETEVAKALESELARFKQPKRLYFLEELPRNAMGKVQKNLLRERYAEAFAETPG
ncbi:MAG: malonyl-CoA synthase [Rhodospirillales bacterium]